MDSVVPSYLSIGGVAFPLIANTAGFVGVAGSGSDDVFSALSVVADEMTGGDFKDTPIEQLEREGFREQEVSAVPVTADRSVESLLDGPISWRRLSGSWPDLTSAFMVRTGFTRRALVIPREVLFELVTQLRVLRADVLAGRRHGRVDDTPVPPPRPLTPELEEYERLRTISAQAAWAFSQELYARRG